MTLAVISLMIFPALAFVGTHIAWAEGVASVEEKIALIEAAYKNASDIKGTFVQKNHIVELKKKDRYSGSFVIGIPSRMRWSYEGENPQEVIVNGAVITVYQENEKQAFKRAFDKEAYGQIPVALISGLGDLRADFEISDAKGGLMLKPKKPIGSVVSVRLTVAKGGFPIKGLLITDKFSNTVEITLVDVRINTGLTGTEFEFTPPPGVTVHEQDR